MSMEEEIPALFHETIPALIKEESPENVKRLANIIQSKEFSNIFVCIKEPTQTFEQYEATLHKYKSFTVWLLGQFFYLLNSDKLKIVQNVIIDVQISILQQLSKTHLHIYQELAEEYCKALEMLMNFYEDLNTTNLELKVFIPASESRLSHKLNPIFINVASKKKGLALVGKLLKFYEFILSESFKFYSFDPSTAKTLDNLTNFLSICNFSCALKIFDIFNNIAKFIKHLHPDCPPNLLNKLSKIGSLLEQKVYDVYNEVLEITNEEFTMFEGILYQYLIIKSDLINNNRIIEFLYKKIIHCNNTLTPNDKIKQFCCNSDAFFTNKDSLHQLIVNNNDNVLFSLFKNDIISELLENNSQEKELKAFDSSVCNTWSIFHNLITSKIEQTSCHSNNACQIVTLFNFLNNIIHTLLEIEINFRLKTDNKIKLLFFKEETLFYSVLKLLDVHISSNCSQEIGESDILRFFNNLLISTNSNNAHIIFYIISCKLLVPAVFPNVDQIPNNFVGFHDVIANKRLLRNLYSFLVNHSDELVCIEFLNDFFKIISTSLVVNVNNRQLEEIETNYKKIFKERQMYQKEQECFSLINGVPYILLIFNNLDLSYDILLPILYCSSEKVLCRLSYLMSTVICCSSSDFIKIVRMQEDKIEVLTFCNECFNINQNNSEDFINKRFKNEKLLITHCKKVKFNLLSKSTILKQICKQYFVLNETTDLKLNILNSLPSFSKHVKEFHDTTTYQIYGNNSIFKVWINLIDDEEKLVRLKLAEVISEIIQSNECEENVDILFETILRVTKKSLQFSNFPLQETLLLTIEPISLIKSKNRRIQIECFKILLYLIMIPTSKYKEVAVNRCLQMAEKCNTTISIMYYEFRHVLCELIVHLCTVNQALINYNLSTSLEKVSLILGFYGVKDFIAQELSYLLPYFVSKIPQMPAVDELISEIATLTEFELEELLIQKYSKIFVYTFLNEDIQGSKACMMYVQEKTKQSGPTLRKMNLRVILNELFLYFHEKKERVLLALNLLAKEVTETHTLNDYIQTQFLALLLHFDIKLTTTASRKDEILHSLADSLRYMGIKHITPLRYKIIRMLQTANYEDYPDAICDVWDAFVHTCQIELLGPQLATIFVSILPLIDNCPVQVNNIFKFLIVDNESLVKEYIPDLFFVKNDLVEPVVTEIIKKYFKVLHDVSLQNKIKQFLKYLRHEHSGIRIYGLKYLKTYFEQSPIDLNELILGCNGIDVNIVELIEILARLCREKDNALKLACGDLIGELGAVEPSHLPRKYNQGGESFSFFIDEDAFILSSLNELITSFQADKNSKNNSNNFALAIQEILKTYEISPETTSSRNRLWLQLNKQQQELIFPFLSSKYMMLREIVNQDFVCPLYGSTSCTSFTIWLENWTCGLINLLPDNYKSLLQKCWSSMKKDHRLLMHFLRYILLHFLLEDTDDRSEKCFIEFKTITSSFFNKKQLNSDLLNTRPMPVPGISVAREIIKPEGEMQIQCTKVVFILLDFLDRWTREWQWQNGQQGQTNEHYKNISKFLNRFSKLELAKCNYQCGEYVRALMYLENHLIENSNDFNGNLTFLAEIYAQLDECDGVAGVTALQQTEPSIEQRILALEISGKLPEAVACYERMPQPLKLHHIQGLVQCHLNLDNVNTALNFIEGSIDNDINFGNMLWEMQAEPLWRLGRYDDLSTLLKRSDLANNKSWGVQIGHCLLHLKNNDQNSFKTVLNALKLQQVDNFGAATLEEGAYQYGYNYILRLHALNELEHLEKIIYELQIQPNDKICVENIMKKFINEWNLRIKVVQDSVRVVEPLLSLRRVGLELGRKIAEEKVKPAVPFFNRLLGKYWLDSAKLARKAGISQQAYTYAIKAEEYAPDRLFLEKAKLHWVREEHEQALRALKRGLETIQPGYSPSDIEKKKILAEAKLLIARYNDTMSNVDSELKLQFYKDAYEGYKEWEKCLVCLAQYYDRLFESYPDAERDESKGSTLQLYIMNYFGKSLKYGTKYIYQSMPRMLSVWFDYGTRSLNVEESRVKEERKQFLLKMTQLIDSLLNCLPAYVFLTAFSQLVSRICHPQRDVYIELKSIIIKLLQNYPQQTLWMFISVIKSSYTIRTRKCSEILNDSRLQLQVFKKIVKDFTSFAEKLIELCHKEIPTSLVQPTVGKLVKSLPQLLAQPDFSNIMMPTQKFRKLVLPNPESNQQNPFPNSYAYIVRIEDEITIVQSLQKPRKIAFRGSDGKRYNFILKANDDLRKDFRLLEFNDIVNQLLSRDSQSRQRRLNIRLYSVAPLNENSGLIEWVPNLLGLQPIIRNLYQKHGFGMSHRQLQKLSVYKNEPLAKKRELFTKTLLPNHPSVLGDWFRLTFPDAQSWFAARTAYIRTTAVMSMAGYILGLGDRHGQNILLDSTCGDVVHVDFNCIFNKGELFDWPERVPFRLTHNMVSAMGPLGVEGVFRKSCACTLRVLRADANILMSIITPVAYDPLVSWPKYVGNVERIDEKAMDHIKNIQLRLKGVVKTTKTNKSTIPLSVDGQVNILISEAMDIDNLCQMFIGWGAYL